LYCKLAADIFYAPSYTSPEMRSRLVRRGVDAADSAGSVKASLVIKR
jgi:hypothetical protein